MKSEKRKPISIVTAFFDIGRGEIGEGYPDYLRRTNDTYFEHFSRLAVLENEMVVFTSEEHRDRIMKLREGKPTKLIIINLIDFYNVNIRCIANNYNKIYGLLFYAIVFISSHTLC